MEVNKDFEEFLKLLNKHEVRYVVVGGYAVVFHGYPRFTGDLDLFYEAEKENAENLLKALKEFGFDFSELNAEELCQMGQITQLGNPPNRIDLINRISGIDFKKTWKTKTGGAYGAVNTFYIGLEDLLQNKLKANRSKDQEDLGFFRRKKN